MLGFLNVAQNCAMRVHLSVCNTFLTFQAFLIFQMQCVRQRGSPDGCWNNSSKLSSLHVLLEGLSAVFNWLSKVISELLWFCIYFTHWLVESSRAIFSTIRSESKTNRGLRVHIFPRFVSAACKYWVLIGLLDCLHPFWLAKVITLVLVLRHSIETRSNRISHFWLVNGSCRKKVMGLQ